MLNKQKLYSQLIATGLPIVDQIDSIKQHFEQSANLILQAEPGAGKTTIVPLALLDLIPATQKIIMLEPRRLAARNAALRMASLCGDKVGETVGFRVRSQTCVSQSTRIEAITEGILTRLIQTDPELTDVALIIFDEFHERSIHTDLGLALSLEVQQNLRDDLKLLVMSATLDVKAVSQLLNKPPLIQSQGRCYPVSIEYITVKSQDDYLSTIPFAVNKLLKVNLNQSDNKDILIFLPGVAEINRAEQLLNSLEQVSEELKIIKLYGDLPIEEQQTVLKPTTGVTKVILATNIAETSLTIEGVGCVIDSGFERQSYFDPNVGFNRLKTLRISKASAEQRAGRAGRLSAGKCIRLWAESESLRSHTLAEIQRSDLANLVLEFAKWGTTDINSSLLLEKPNQGALSQAIDLLTAINALNQNRITSHGKEILELGVHPRLGHMLIQSVKLNVPYLACIVSAMLEEKDVFSGEQKRDVDFVKRIEFVIDNSSSVVKRIKQQAEKLINKLSRMYNFGINRQTEDLKLNIHKVSWLLALAFPERIAIKRGNGYLLANGSGAQLKQSIFNHKDLLVIVQLGGKESTAIIFQAAPLLLDDFKELYQESIEEIENVYWEQKQNRVVAEKCQHYLNLKFNRVPINNPSQLLIQQAILDGIKQQGIDCLPWSKDNYQWLSRISMLSKISEFKEEFPHITKEFLESHLDSWLQPYLLDIKSLKDVSNEILTQALINILDWNLQQRLDKLMPVRFIVPSGSAIRVDYCQGEKPVLAVKLQEMFGEKESPQIANNKIRMVVHLLSPAQRPIQITEDLASFWQSSYQDVKKEMKGRYPKHPWPDDPITASATRLTKRALNNS